MSGLPAAPSSDIEGDPQRVSLLRSFALVFDMLIAVAAGDFVLDALGVKGLGAVLALCVIGWFAMDWHLFKVRVVERIVLEESREKSLREALDDATKKIQEFQSKLYPIDPKAN